MTREPGDLPSFVVTRENVGRGALMWTKPVVWRIVRRVTGGDPSQ
ncbi:hypothetical protein [Methylocystis sp. H62]|nr:hypothetical protein [Methylocystis sp. H62]